jgi:hypothetical protein
MEFEPMIPAFERAKAFHALDRAATVIGRTCFSLPKFCILPIERIFVFLMILYFFPTTQH